MPEVMGSSARRNPRAARRFVSVPKSKVGFLLDRIESVILVKTH